MELTLNDSESKLDFKVDEKLDAIDRLGTNPKHHEYVLSYLNKRIRVSENEMSKFYNRWRVAEAKAQAYLNLPKYEKILKDMNKRNEPPAPALIVYPYLYANIASVVTYMMRVFCARKPMFQAGATNQETAKRHRQMETMLQHHADMNTLVMKLNQHFRDGELYGLGILRTIWRARYARRSLMRAPTPAEMIFNKKLTPQSLTKDYEDRKIYDGNDIENIDPFMFFPDPSVPMSEVAEKGEWVVWRNYVGRHVLITDQKNDYYKYCEKIPDGNPTESNSKWYNLSNRNLMSDGNATAGSAHFKNEKTTNVIQLDQGTFKIIPKELGLGDSDKPEIWIFTIANRGRIIQAQPLAYDHAQHPVSVAEPYTMGYGFGQPALSDYISPIQDIVSWFLASHIYNVRTALNNMFVYDPSKIEGQDLKNPQPGKTIRVKPAGVGADVRTLIQQIPVQDVTRGHMNDLQAFLRIGDQVSAINDNMRGVVREGGRKTATEVRVSGESAASRLAAQAQIYSAQSISKLANQMCLNIQQFQEDDVYLKVLGEEDFRTIGPADLMGDFVFPIHDGTLPLDRIAAFDIWKEVLMGMMQDQELRQSHSAPKLFEWVAEQGGAINISSFRTPAFAQIVAGQGMTGQVMPDEQVESEAQAGNLVPIGGM